MFVKEITKRYDGKAVVDGVSFEVPKGKVLSLIGPNGAGKSTVMGMLSRLIARDSGLVDFEGTEITRWKSRELSKRLAILTQANNVQMKLTVRELVAFGRFPYSGGRLTQEDNEIIDRAIAYMELGDFEEQFIDELSGGQRQRAYIAMVIAQDTEYILLDEPTNHLDTSARERFYDFIRRTSATALIISHDRTLLNLLPAICELSRNKLTYYGGSYDFYKEQKKIHQNALLQQLEEKEKAFRLARKTAREVEERKAKQNVRGEKAALKKGIPRIMMGNLKNHAENSTGKLNNIHIQKSEKIRQEVMDIRNSLSQTDKLKTDFNASALHTGKILVTAQNINFHYPDSNTNLWTVPLSFQLRSGNRFCIKGDNGSGKTTLLRLITGELTPTGGTIERADFTYVYLDQEYSLIQNEYTVSEQAEAFNLRHLPEHEIKTVLNRYLFPQDVWNKPCGKLSGGEKMRLAFCCLMIADNTPDLFILDEPTNNLDIESIEIITATIRNYQGTVLAVSHDRDFLKETGIEQEISFFL